jgi:hypothetical protein
MKIATLPPHRIARACECGDHGFMGFQTWHVAFFDACHAPIIAGHVWSVCHAYRRHPYVEQRQTKLILHRLLSAASVGFVVDHINGDTMDNRSKNLRVCSHAENMRNRRKHKIGKSEFKGIYPVSNGWAAEAVAGKRRIRKSGFKTALEAARFYDEAATILHGEYARTNRLAIAQVST